jgi:hypothetical protein
MNSTAVVAIVAALIGAGGTLAAVLLTYRLSRRRISDKEQFGKWQVVFDRPAFRGPYLWKSDPVRFESTITIIIEAINTGHVTSHSDNERKGLRGIGKSQLRDPKLREIMDAVVDHLLRVRALVRKQIEIRKMDPAANLTLDQLKEMDEHRDWIISTMNESWSKFRLGTLKLPTEIRNYEDVYEQAE